jgi:hypothetical protein
VAAREAAGHLFKGKVPRSGRGAETEIWHRAVGAWINHKYALARELIKELGICVHGTTRTAFETTNGSLSDGGGGFLGAKIVLRDRKASLGKRSRCMMTAH